MILDGPSDGPLDGLWGGLWQGVWDGLFMTFQTVILQSFDDLLDALDFF